MHYYTISNNSKGYTCYVYTTTHKATCASKTFDTHENAKQWGEEVVKQYTTKYPVKSR